MDEQSFTWRDDLYYIDQSIDGSCCHRREFVVSWLRFWLTYIFSFRNYERVRHNRIKENTDDLRRD